MTNADYDVIVVGSGSAGAALAGRLSDGGRNVLLLEAGAAYNTVDSLPPEIREPSGVPVSMPGHPANWSMPGTLYPGMSMPLPRGKILGGSSSINGCYFIRGLPANFDSWAEQGFDEWSYEKVLPFFKALESDHDFDDDSHGASGPIHVNREPISRAPAFNNAFTEACKDLGHDDEPDKNGGGKGGVGPIPVNIDKGMRISTAVGYLFPRMGRKTLTIRGGVFVLRVLIDNGSAIGVEAMENGKTVRFHSSEVVLAAGALRSPHLLMLSGIGPAVQLRGAGVKVVHDLPGVGQNMRDHPEVVVNYSVDVDIPDLPGRGPMGPALHWESEGGRYAGDLEMFPFLKTIKALQGPASVALKRPLQTMKAMKGISLHALKAVASAGQGDGSMVLGLQQSESRGEVRIVSADPTVHPKLDWRLMTAPEDVRRLRELVTICADLFDTAAMRSVGGKLVDFDRKALTSSAAFDSWVRTRPIMVGHPTSTCRMGLPSDGGAVVDQFGHVYGIDGLRVADTSMWPMAVSRGPNATAVMTGERIAAFMVEGR